MFFNFFGVIFQKNGQNGRPGGREPPGSISFRETIRIVLWKTTWAIFWKICKKSVKTAVPEDGNPPGALVFTKLIEWYCGKLPGSFFGKIAKIWKQYKKIASATKGRASRAPFASIFVVLFPYFLQFFQKIGPGCFLHRLLLLLQALTAFSACVLCRYRRLHLLSLQAYIK